MSRLHRRWVTAALTDDMTLLEQILDFRPDVLDAECEVDVVSKGDCEDLSRYSLTMVRVHLASQAGVYMLMPVWCFASSRWGLT